jgi:hypothetical protein
MEDAATMRSYGAEAKTFHSRIIEVRVTPFLDQAAIPRSEDGVLFSAQFRETVMDMHIQSGGGARPLSCGLYAVSSGFSDPEINPFVGIAIWDKNGENMKFPTSFTGKAGAPAYDPFIFFQPKFDPFNTWGLEENWEST